MIADWQDIVALIAVAVAGIYLAWRGFLTMKRKRDGCGGCATCAAPAVGDRKTLVTIDLPQKARDRA